MRENSLEKQLKTRIEADGGMFIKLAPVGQKGIPDRMVIDRFGKVYFIELKAEDGRLMPKQVYWQERLKRQGCDCRVLKGEKGVKDFIMGLRREDGK